MKNSGKLTCAEARKYDMVDYLSRLGHEPKKVRGNNYWYLSPLRDEKTPSFKVDRKLNVWTDWGDTDEKGKVLGGNLIDFAILYHKCSVVDFLIKLENSSLLPPGLQTASAPKEQEEESKIIITKDQDLTHPALLGYLRQRRIPVHLASEYCREITFNLYDKSYFAVGFRNNFGGFELRNTYFKGSSSPKGYTSIQESQERSTLCVFEGFMDFLSYLTIIPENDRRGKDMLILNSLVFFESARPLMESYQGADLFLDHNKSGRKVTDYACKLDKIHYKDQSKLYAGYEDLNDMLCHFGRTQKNKNRLSPGS